MSRPDGIKEESLNKLNEAKAAGLFQDRESPDIGPQITGQALQPGQAVTSREQLLARLDSQQQSLINRLAKLNALKMRVSFMNPRDARTVTDFLEQLDQYSWL